MNNMKQITLPVGTKLYHGTAKAKRFRMLNTPAFFAFDSTSGWRWAIEWDRQPLPRVLVFEVTRSVELADTAELNNWLRFADKVLAWVPDGTHPDDSIGEFARTVQRAGLPGWFGQTEIMLTNVSMLRYVHTLVRKGVTR